MALITSFDHRPGAGDAFRTEVSCGWVLGQLGDRKILHLETYGSSERAIPGKVSQSIELDENSARELKGILEGAFPSIVDA